MKIGIVMILIIIVIGLYYYYGSSAASSSTGSNAGSSSAQLMPTGKGTSLDPNLLIGVYKDPNNANNLTVVNQNGKFYMVEVNGVQHLMTFTTAGITFEGWPGSPATWDATHIGQLTKIR